MPVGRTGLQHADGDVGVFAQPVGEHAAGAACADNHVIERVHFHPRGFLLSASLAPGGGMGKGG